MAEILDLDFFVSTRNAPRFTVTAILVLGLVRKDVHHRHFTKVDLP